MLRIRVGLLIIYCSTVLFLFILHNRLDCECVSLLVDKLCVHPLGTVRIYNEVVGYWRWLSRFIKFLCLLPRGIHNSK